MNSRSALPVGKSYHLGPATVDRRIDARQICREAEAEAE
jgi:hypothetical protein